MSRSRRVTNGHAPSGVLLIDKPSGITSHDVVARVRRILGTRAVGHCGTLDPLASGLLILLVGPCTRLMPYVVSERKRYQCTCQLGLRTDSLDSDGEVLSRQCVDVSAAQISAALEPLRGDILQVPPRFSAVHVDGQRAHVRARRGEDFDIPARPIKVYFLELVEREGDLLHLKIEVSKGGFVRSLVRDLGEALGCGATVTGLRRTRSGDLSVDGAIDLATLEAQGEQAPKNLLPGLNVFDRQRRYAVDASEVIRLRKGQRIKLRDLAPSGPAPWLAHHGDDLIAVVEPAQEEPWLGVRRGFPAPS